MLSIQRIVLLSSVALCSAVAAFGSPACLAQAQQGAVDAPPGGFRYLVDPTLGKEPRVYREIDGSLHNVALVRDQKGVVSAFVDDEIVVRNDPAAVAALVSKYKARVVRQIKVNMISTDGKPLPPAQTTPTTVLQIDATASPLRLEEEALAIKALGTHTFSTQKAANLAAILAHERAAGRNVHLYVLGEAAGFTTSSKEQADLNGVSDAYRWPEFDHRAWQYVAAAGVKMHPTIAIIDGGFWLNSKGIPCGYAIDSLCQVTGSPAGRSDLPAFMIEGDATGGSGTAGGENPATCTGGSSCPWHGNKSASVAVGAVNNGTGAAGMGGPVAIPMLIKTDTSIPETVAAIEAAVSHGASIISISSTADCNSWCQTWYTITGSSTSSPNGAMESVILVVAAAGNDSQDAGDANAWPCTAFALSSAYSPLCVGAMYSAPDNNGYFTEMYGGGSSYSNYGHNVQIWAPTNIHTMPDGSSNGALTYHDGTSASTPYVAGVAALMKAVNPSLTGPQLASILIANGQQCISSAYPSDLPQDGVLIYPLQAVLAANSGKSVAPEITITSPKSGDKVGQAVFQAVIFTASVENIFDGKWPNPPVNGACPEPPSMGSAGRPLGPVVWTSSAKDDVPMGQGASIRYVFSPTAKPGKRTIKATVTNAQGLSASNEITVDYEPQIGAPNVVIMYPPPGATVPAGTIPVRGYAKSAAGLGDVSCDELQWQKGIAATPIKSTAVEGGVFGECGAQVPFAAGKSSQTLKLTAKDVTGKVGEADETLTIAPASNGTSLSIVDPADNESFLLYSGQSVAIGLSAHAENPPSSPVYTWSWSPAGAGGAVSKTTIGTGRSLTWTNKTACGDIVVEVAVTSPSVSSNPSPTATRNIQVDCSAGPK